MAEETKYSTGTLEAESQANDMLGIREKGKKITCNPEKIILAEVQICENCQQFSSFDYKKDIVIY